MPCVTEWITSTLARRRTRSATARGSSTICIGAPRPSASCSSPWRRPLKWPFLRNHLGQRPPVGVETVEVYPLGGRERPTAFWWHAYPAKKHGPWVVAHVRVVTPSGDPV